MNSTDSSELAPLFERLFRTISDIAQVRRLNGIESLDLAPAAPTDTYFVAPRRPHLEHGELAGFESGDLPTSVIEELVAFWTAEGSADMAALGEGLTALVAALAQERSENPDVSPLVYVMY